MGIITISTQELQTMLQETARTAVREILNEIKPENDDISYRQGVERWGRWFRINYESGRIKGKRWGSGKNAKLHFSVKEIESLRSAERIKAQIINRQGFKGE